ncbi:hypothetical protein [Nitrosopumilus sp.]|uniref:hypothetical protein n=1 Tax=Nitrosopumilus sp. TaxID=2024843 RepID=UPI0026286609|nr:hypothetical protein [Nitrosopumilus sp.]
MKAGFIVAIVIVVVMAGIVIAGNLVSPNQSSDTADIPKSSAPHELSQSFQQSSQPARPSCDPSYSVCIPPYPPDLDCGEIPHSNFRVSGSDPHGFDRDGDGIGCES